MTVPEILKELEPCTGRFPMKAMRAAVEQREAITPQLLKVLETCAADPVAFARREDYMLHVFALFLLAQFREKRAYPLAVKIFSAPGEVPFDLHGDTVTECRRMWPRPGHRQGFSGARSTKSVFGLWSRLRPPPTPWSWATCAGCMARFSLRATGRGSCPPGLRSGHRGRARHGELGDSLRGRRG
jgi:hypothetical protein